LFVSAVTVAELLHGALRSTQSERNLSKVDAFLAPYTVLAFDAPTAANYGRLAANSDRDGSPIGSLDLQIAATALTHDLVLVTHDAAFGRIADLKLEDWE
jgi:tRNA(fMet)-specific endonuclease VapC